MPTIRSRSGSLSPGNTVLALGTLTVLLLGVAVTALTGFPYLESLIRTNGNAYDFGIFYRSAVALWQGGSLYPAGQPNFLPPGSIVLLSPLAVLPPIVAYRLFLIGSVVAVVAALAMVVRAVHSGSARATIVVGATMASPGLLVTLAQGQIYTLLALGLSTAWVLDRSGRSVGAGIVLGVVVAVKPILLPVLLWPAIRGHRRGSSAGLATAALITLVGVLVAGPAQTLRYLAVVRTGFPHEDLDNASLATAGLRLFTQGRQFAPVIDAPLLGWAVSAVAVAILLLTLLRARGDLSLWSIVAASLMTSPIAWRGYLVLLVPGVLILAVRDRTRWLGAIALALLLLPHQTPALWSDTTSLGFRLAAMLGPVVLLGLWCGLYMAPAAQVESAHRAASAASDLELPSSATAGSVESGPGAGEAQVTR